LASRRLRAVGRLAGARTAIAIAPAALSLAWLSFTLLSLSALPLALSRALRGIRGRRRVARQFDLAALAQLVGAVGDDGFADLQAAGDGNALAFGRPGLDLAHADRAVLGDDVYK